MNGVSSLNTPSGPSRAAICSMRLLGDLRVVTIAARARLDRHHEPVVGGLTTSTGRDSIQCGPASRCPDPSDARSFSLRQTAAWLPPRRSRVGPRFDRPLVSIERLSFVNSSLPRRRRLDRRARLSGQSVACYHLSSPVGVVPTDSLRQSAPRPTCDASIRGSWAYRGEGVSKKNRQSAQGSARS